MHSSGMRTARVNDRLSCMHAPLPAMHAPTFLNHHAHPLPCMPLAGMPIPHMPPGQTDTYKNITFPQLLLWAVIIVFSKLVCTY